MDFMIGCNYWASNAGTEMWNMWDESAITEDLKILSSHGIKYMRVFPNWRDFQPVIPVLGTTFEYMLEGDRSPKNPYYIDEIMLERFSRFCDLCHEYGIKLIVGLLTGWMSGRHFIPPVLYNKNLCTDSVALMFEQRFVKGMVTEFKDKPAIYAWDLGNECNCMAIAKTEEEATTWTAIISNAIRACDNTRPVISGMHGLFAEPGTNPWTIKGQAEFCDILTTHPYPLWCRNTYVDYYATLRTTMHATCETKFYADLSGKPCFVEEIGTMGPMFCDNDIAADFMRVNLFSNFANGSEGVLWWCANEHINLNTAPYIRQMAETELGMIDKNRNPKPVLKETKRVAEILSEINLPKAQTDAVCILTEGQNQWGVAYMSYCLAKQAKLNISFAYCSDKLPESDIYMLPSISGVTVMPKKNYEEIKRHVFEGATLYISNDTGVLSEFEELCGLSIRDTGMYKDSLNVNFAGSEIPFTREKRYKTTQKAAEILAYDSMGLPAISVNKYGKGKVYYVNFPLEAMLIEKNDAFEEDYYKIYNEIFKESINGHKIYSDNKNIALTIHPATENEAYVVAINHSDAVQKAEFKTSYKISEILYGNIDTISPFDAVIFKIKD